MRSIAAGSSRYSSCRRIMAELHPAFHLAMVPWAARLPSRRPSGSARSRTLCSCCVHGGPRNQPGRQPPPHSRRRHIARCRHLTGPHHTSYRWHAGRLSWSSSPGGSDGDVPPILMSTVAVGAPFQCPTIAIFDGRELLRRKVGVEVFDLGGFGDRLLDDEVDELE
jgi:hypothetical protein